MKVRTSAFIKMRKIFIPCEICGKDFELGTGSDKKPLCADCTSQYGDEEEENVGGKS